MNDAEFEEAVAEFVGAFEVVFRYDWQYTKQMIGDEEPGRTFIEPGLDDELEDWGARAALLETYRKLISVMQKNGIDPRFPFPLDRLPDSKKRVW